MWDMVLADLKLMFETVIQHAELMTLVFLGVVSLIGAFMMRGLGQLVGTALFCLVLFAAALYVYGALNFEAVDGVSPWEAQFKAGWTQVMGLPTRTLVGYFLAFCVGVLVLFGAKSIFLRGE